MARIFPNDAWTAGSANKGIYYWDADSNGTKGICDSPNPGNECKVDVWYNVAEGSLKGTYTNALTALLAPKGEIKAMTKKPVNYATLHDYGSEAAFITQVDNTMAGQMRDCAECHVGGGAMEYVPQAQGATLNAAGVTTRLSLRGLGSSFDGVSDTYGGGSNPVVDGNYTTFNYFIDQYNEDDDGLCTDGTTACAPSNGDADCSGLDTCEPILGEVIKQDYAVTGVLEMDCLICHLEDYNYADRRHAIRTGNFDSSRAVGANLIVAGSGYTGTTVTYDANKVADGNLTAEVLSAIEGAPPSANCSSCHFDIHAVDWKKRGASWNANMAYETEVHGALGCIGCHERTDGMTMDPNNGGQVGDNPLWTGNAKTSPGTLGHDPAKGNAPYSSLWNATDGKAAKTCAGCHTSSPAYESYGAPDPTAAHTAAGLLETIIQKGNAFNMAGTADGNHLDIIDCSGCHTRKLGHGPYDGVHSLYEWGTGAAMVDATGPDKEGRLTDHENLYIERTMENNLVRRWIGSKIYPAHSLVTMFWRDKDDLFGYGNAPSPNAYTDINADGQTGAMDAVNPSHLRNIMNGAGLRPLTEDGNMTGADIGAQKSAMMNGTTGLAAYGIDMASHTPKLKLSFMGVMFKANHGTSPAKYAYGSGGCADCHSVNGGFYNGGYDLKPRDLTASWDNFVPNAAGKTFDNSAIGGGKPKWKHVVPFTKVNTDNYSSRDVTLPICSTYYGSSARPATPTQGTLADIGNACDGGAGIWTVYPLGKIKADYQYTDFHPTQFAKKMKGRSIAIKAAYGSTGTIRTMDRSEALWEASFVTGTFDGDVNATNGVNNIATRANWVTRLNGIGGVHNRHMQAGIACSTCHDVDYDNVDADASITVTTTPTPEALTIAYDTSAQTCTTNCHIGISAPPSPAYWDKFPENHVIAFASALAGDSLADSPDWDEVILQGERSTCCNMILDDNGVESCVDSTCTYSWTVDAACSQTGGSPATDTYVVTCGGVGTYPASLTVTDTVTGKSNTDAFDIIITSSDVNPLPDPNYGTPGVVGNTVTVDMTDLPGNIIEGYVYWGDGTRTVFGQYQPIPVPTASLSHDYAIPSGKVIRIKIFDNDMNQSQVSITVP